MNATSRDRRPSNISLPGDAQPRPSFTLLELLISLGIILILATLTMRLLNATLNSDRIRNGTREFQTFLAGARDRAVYAGQPRGVRLIQDPLDRSTAHSFVYIGAPSTFTDGTSITINTDLLTINTLTGSPPVPNPTTTPPAVWAQLVQRGLLTDGATINIGGTFYTMARNPPPSTANPTGGPWMLTKTFAGTAGASLSYTLQLLPSVVPGEEPRSLPNNIVIDLDNSVLPSTWGSPGAWAGSLDLLFAPNGTVTGTVAAAGRLHFVLSEYVDATIPIPLPTNSTVTGVPLLDANKKTWVANQPYVQEQWVVPITPNDLVFRCVVGGTSGGAQPAGFATATPGSQIPGDGGVTWECYNPKARLVVSLATETGRVTTSPVTPADPFRFAEIGEVTQ
jgi:type II secretory pathway pseudopilin PulG